jgi:hypothetical protein
MNSLIPCPECSRHVRRTEAACPFCAAEIGATLSAAPERAMPTSRLGRSALFAFAAVSVGAAACSSDTNSPTGSTVKVGDASTDGARQGDGGGAMALYGAPAAGGQGVGGNPGAGGVSQNGSGGNFQALYGGPPSGGTANGAGGEMTFPVYGAPFPTGGAANDGSGGSVNKGGSGGFAALYGLPPAP